MTTGLEHIVFLLNLLISPFVYLAIGYHLFSLILKFSRRAGVVQSDLSEMEGLFFPVCFLAGLLFNLSFILVGRNIGLSWGVVTALPGILLLFDRTALLFLYRATVEEFKSLASINFALWFTCILLIGASLFDTANGISTPWVNNYGDLTFHIGQISSFIFGNNFPPQYAIYAGEKLSYPYFINLWSASLWWISPSWRTLSIVFFVQWVSLWTLVYFAVARSSLRIVPWAILIGGGSYKCLFSILMPKIFGEPVKYAHELIEKGYPWTPFITTIWIPQRSSIFGVAVLVTVVACLKVHRAERKPISIGLIAAGMLLALMPIAHAHFFIIGSLYFIWSFFADWLFRSKHVAEGKQLEMNFDGAVLPPETAWNWSGIIVCAVILLGINLGQLTVLHGKEGIMTFSYGWMPWTSGSNNGTPTGNYGGAIGMWLANAPLFLVCLVGMSLGIGEKKDFLILMLLFFAANFIILAVWHWDQLKLFLGIYIVMLVGLARSERLKLPKFQTRYGISRIPGWGIGVFEGLLFLLCVPAVVEIFREIVPFDNYQVYSPDDIQVAELLRKHSAPNAIILAKPDHNSAVTLSGRKLFSGYEGTLSSHGLDYAARSAMMKDLTKAVKCDNAPAVPKELCPNFLIWTARETGLWNMAQPPAELNLEKFSNGKIFRIR